MNLLHPLNFNRNAALNLVFQRLGTAPANPELDQVYVDSGGAVQKWDGSAWVEVGRAPTAAEILALLLTVDGADTGLDADLLDGLQATAFRRANVDVPAAEISGLQTFVDARTLAIFDRDAPDDELDTVAEALQRVRDNADLLASLQGGNVKRFVETFGDGTTTTFTFAHGLDTEDFTHSVRVLASGEQVLADVRPSGNNAATFTVSTPPVADSLRITIIA